MSGTAVHVTRDEPSRRDGAAPRGAQTPRSGPPAGGSRTAVTAGDLLLLGLGIVATLALAWALLRGAWDALAIGVAVAVCVALALSRTRLARLRLHAVLVTLAVALPALGVLGPALAAPPARPLFAFRIALALLALLGMCRIARGPAAVTAGPRGLRTALLLWYAWMIVTLLWAPDKVTGLEYLVTTATMLVLTFCVAACAVRARYLHALLWLLAGVLVLTVLLAAAELGTGWHLPGSAALVSTSQKATAWFVNANDLATYFAICWPFVLLGVIVTRRARLRACGLLLLAALAAIVLFTGSRTSLVTIAVQTVIVGFVTVRCGWLTGRRLVLTGALLVVLIGGMGILALNETDIPFLRQFRLVGVAEDVQAGQGSGDVRLSLAKAGFSAANRYFYAGVGPGNAEELTKQSEEVSVAFGNLHSWWFEVFVNSGLPGFVLFVLFFAGCIVVCWRAMRRSRSRTEGWLAAAVTTALLGFIVGAFGPSTAASFAPMWVLYGLALAVVVRARDGDGAAAAAGGAAAAALTAAAPVAAVPPVGTLSATDPGSPTDVREQEQRP